MALVVITVQDTPEGAQVSVVGEPLLEHGPLAAPTHATGAQHAALIMLKALQSEIKEDRGLIALIN